RHAPDATVLFVAVGITETGLIMADDRVVPIAEIKGAIGTELHVHRAKTATGRLDQWRPVFEAEARAVVADGERPHGVVDVTAHNERALPGIGEMRCADDVAAADFAAVAILPDERGRGGPAVEHQTGHGINRRAVVAREHDGFAPVGEDKAPRILGL